MDRDTFGAIRGCVSVARELDKLKLADATHNFNRFLCCMTSDDLDEGPEHASS